MDFGGKAQNPVESILALEIGLALSQLSTRSVELLAFDAVMVQPNEGDVELFALAVLLHSISKIKCIVQFEALKHIQPSA